MKLYYNPYGCSLAAVIAALEAGIELDLVWVDILKDPHLLADGRDYAGIAPKNYVPALVRDDGSMLTEVAVILQYLADLAPASGLAAAAETEERLRQQEWLNFLASELHKFFSPWLFHDEVGETAQAYARRKIAERFAVVEARLGHGDYLFGAALSAADAYLFVMVNWCGFARVQLEPFPRLRAWFERMRARPAVVRALKLHGRQPEAAAA